MREKGGQAGRHQGTKAAADITTILFSLVFTILYYRVMYLFTPDVCSLYFLPYNSPTQFYDSDLYHALLLLSPHRRHGSLLCRPVYAFPVWAASIRTTHSTDAMYYNNMYCTMY